VSHDPSEIILIADLIADLICWFGA